MWRSLAKWCAAAKFALAGNGASSKRSSRFPSPTRRSDRRTPPRRRHDHSRRTSITDRENQSIK
jgi:hypothetical protein